MSRDVAVDGEVVVAQRVLVRRVAEGTLTLCRQRGDNDKPGQRPQPGTVKILIIQPEIKGEGVTFLLSLGGAPLNVAPVWIMS